ncbi:hypothetical protein ASPCAL04703 [Aspergillus calidoustus]|uniref:Uncharacterized protein n=1 Tax=Aspergillus calidoustus TaxID=454130 RepID=A0A0U5FY25_ASPCI|nr:hypothetical protein ASPCAL04703 [Aspergillus calidoustus]
MYQSKRQLSAQLIKDPLRPMEDIRMAFQLHWEHQGIWKNEGTLNNGPLGLWQQEATAGSESEDAPQGAQNDPNNASLPAGSFIFLRAAGFGASRPLTGAVLKTANDASSRRFT